MDAYHFWEWEKQMLARRPSVVSRAPRSYPRQRGLTCGEYNARGVIEAFGVPYQPPTAPRLRIRMLGYSFVKDISDLLEAHGISAPVRHAAKLSPDQKISAIRDCIDHDQPVILAIGNGHLRRGDYSPVARYFLGHFITVYGYSQEDDTFFIYDSYLRGHYHERIPIGNEVRTSREMLTDWAGPLYYKLVRMDHVYIPAGVRE